MPELEENTGLINYENYGSMKEFVTNEFVTINTDDINPDTWDQYFLGIFNIFKDGIEDPIIRSHYVNVVFGDTGKHCRLFITDFLINLQMWYCIIYSNGKIKPYHLMKDKNGIKSSHIKKFVDEYFIKEYRNKMDFKSMNNIIDDCLYNWFTINEFSNYLSDTLNLKDSIDLCRVSPEYNSLLHSDLSQYNMEEFNKIALKLTDRMIEFEKHAKEILGYEHCMANAHRAGQSPRKQLKEGFISVGPKPDGNGNVYSHPINNSYVGNGVYDIADFFVDSAVSRTAQILSHVNVGDSGHFARLLGLNNSGSFINMNKTRCNTKRLVEVELKTEKHAEMFIDRYCKTDPNGLEILITKNNYKNFTGKTIYLYSPMTCNSHSHHDGICKRCYGLLYLINHSINIGKIAAEILSRICTQYLLSVKHIMEGDIKKAKWSKEFYKYFDVEYNYVILKPDVELKNAYIVIDPNDIVTDNEEDYNNEDPNGTNINEHIESFVLKIGNKSYTIKDEDNREFYISNNLNGLIRKSVNMFNEDSESVKLIKVPIDSIDEETPIFYIRLLNNEISKLLNSLINLIAKKNTASLSLDGMLQQFIDITVEANLGIRGIHCEVLLSNQIHNPIDIFEPIDWSNPSAIYKMVTLNDALLNNPSPTVTLMYQNIGKTLFAPLTYKKNGPSFLDLFFMQHPQGFLNSKFAKSEYDSEDTERVPWTIKLPKKNEPRRVDDLPIYFKDGCEN